MQRTIDAQAEEISRLSRLVEGAPAAGIAQTILTAAELWAHDQSLPQEPHGPFPTTEDALHDGLREAARIAGLNAMGNLTAAEQATLAAGSLSPDERQRMILAGFATQAHRDPVGMLASLPEAYRKLLLTGLSGEPRVIDALERQIHEFSLRETAMGPIQTEYNSTGRFDMSDLPHGTRVFIDVDYRDKNGSEHIECRGIVIDTDDGPYVEAHGEPRHPFKHPFRLGHITSYSDGDFDTLVNPHGEIDTIYYKDSYSVSFGTNSKRMITAMHNFGLDGEMLELDSDTRYVEFPAPPAR